jgi:DNA polymerase III alpha subunit
MIRENLDAEYEALGMMISGSPLSFYKDILASRHITPLSELPDSVGTVETAGVVKEIRAITTRGKGPRWRSSASTMT